MKLEVKAAAEADPKLVYSCGADSFGSETAGNYDELYDLQYDLQTKPLIEEAANCAEFSMAVLNPKLRRGNKDAFKRLCEIVPVLLVSECARVDIKCVRVAFLTSDSISLLVV